MSMSTKIRQIHRWLSIAFTAAVVANIAANLMGTASVWIGLLALLPLVALMLTGLYLFALPHVGRRRSAGG